MKCLCCSKPLDGRKKKFCSLECKNKINNLKYQNYPTQSERGYAVKKKLIGLKGGECQKCGYKKNYAGLCFHHVNGKDFQLDSRKCANTKWDTLLEEADKCVLLCHNCHMEEHYPHQNMVGPTGLEPVTNEL